MPVLFDFIGWVSFNLSQKISLEHRHCVFCDNTVLGPLGQVLSVEAGIEGLSEHVEIDVVKLETVKHVKGSNSCHI